MNYNSKRFTSRRPTQGIGGTGKERIIPKNYKIFNWVIWIEQSPKAKGETFLTLFKTISKFSMGGAKRTNKPNYK